MHLEIRVHLKASLHLVGPCEGTWAMRRAILFYFIIIIIILAIPHSMQDLSSPTRDLTRTAAVEAWNLNHWTIREVPRRAILEYSLLMSFLL